MNLIIQDNHSIDGDIELTVIRLDVTCENLLRFTSAWRFLADEADSQNEIEIRSDD